MTTHWWLHRHSNTDQNSISLQRQLGVHTSKKKKTNNIHCRGETKFTFFLSAYFLMESPVRLHIHTHIESAVVYRYEESVNTDPCGRTRISRQQT